MKPKTLLINLTFICAIYVLARATPNLWGLLVDPNYFIPTGSTIFTFRPTMMNPGSGDWWIYGEDSRYYYYFEDDIKISKQTAETCQEFDKVDVTTWC
jgi:hypothetical protein